MEKIVRHNIAEVELTYRPKQTHAERVKIENSDDAEPIFRLFWNENTIDYCEEFKVMYLNRNNQVLGIYHHAKGGLSGVMCDVRMIFQAALKANAHSIILAHNHPSGNLEPSQADIDLTNKLREAGRILDIQVHDHLILTAQKYMSLANRGYL
jgi:DNA repair protein RadC